MDGSSNLPGATETMEKKDVREAAERINSHIKKTPLVESRSLNEMCGCRVFLKLENLQRTGSFKIRGAANRLLTLSIKDKEAGIVTPSMGNHGESIAAMSSILNINCTLVLPRNVKKSKIDAIQGYGIKYELYGKSYDDAFQRAGELSKERGYTMINSYEDEAIMAGNGTLAMEVADEIPDLNTLIVPVGSGGLLAGTLLALEGRDIKIKGVEPEGASSMSVSMKKGKPTSTPDTKTIATGLAARHPGVKPFGIIKERIGADDIVLVSDNEIMESVLFLLERKKMLAEPSGAAPLSALMYNKIRVEKNEKVCVIISGGNLDLSILSYFIEKKIAKEGRKLKLSIISHDTPEALKSVIEILENNEFEIIDIDIDRISHGLPLGFCSIQIRARINQNSLQEKCVKRLRSEGHKVIVSY